MQNLCAGISEVKEPAVEYLSVAYLNDKFRYLVCFSKVHSLHLRDLTVRPVTSAVPALSISVMLRNINHLLILSRPWMFIEVTRL